MNNSINEADIDEIYIESSLTRYLDAVLKEANENKNLPRPAAVVNGLTGSGKTPTIRSWLKHNKLPYIEIQSPSRKLRNCEVEYYDWGSLLSGNNMTIARKIEPSLKKKTIQILFSKEEIDSMKSGNVVVFVDDYDWAPVEVRNHLLKLLNHHVVRDDREDGNNFTSDPLKGILMFIYVTHPNHSFSEPYTTEEEEIFGKQI